MIAIWRRTLSLNAGLQIQKQCLNGFAHPLYPKGSNFDKLTQTPGSLPVALAILKYPPFSFSFTDQSDVEGKGNGACPRQF